MFVFLTERVFISAGTEIQYPGHPGDKEKLSENTYRLHISRTYTAFYRINEEIRLFGYIFSVLATRCTSVTTTKIHSLLDQSG